MKILIIGEYSGVSYNLKVGLTKLGHKVINFSEGDGWKKIPINDDDYLFNTSNYTLFEHAIKGSWRIAALFNYLNFRKVIKEYRNAFDLIIIINYIFLRLPYSTFFPRFTINNINYVSKKNAQTFMMACGDDLPYLTKAMNFRYWPHDKDNLSADIYLSTQYLKLFFKIYNKITAVVPCMYDYAESYRLFEGIDKSKIEKTIPPAFAVNNIQHYNVINDGVIKIFHGLNRDNFKGSDIITQALFIIKNKYPTKVDVIINKRMPLSEYLEAIKKANIIIDQCKSYSYGMNALYCMASGKLVMSGNELECQKEYERFDIPVVNILPVVSDIVEKIEYYICNPQEIIDFGIRSRKFVEEFHDPERIAQLYLNLFNKYIL